MASGGSPVRFRESLVHNSAVIGAYRWSAALNTRKIRFR